MTAAVAVVAILVTGLVAAWLVHVSLRDSRTRERAWEKKELVWNQERQQLLDRIMYLADRPWGTPEARDEGMREEDERVYIDPVLQPLPTYEGYDFEPMGTV